MKTLKRIAIGLLLTTLLVGACGVAGTIETHYNRVGNISEVGDDYIVITDKGGNDWVCDTTEPYELGELVTMKMYNNCTEDYMYDDEILSIKKGR